MPDDDERVSLGGLDRQQALKALLAIDPAAPPVEGADEPKADKQEPPVSD